MRLAVYRLVSCCLSCFFINTVLALFIPFFFKQQHLTYLFVKLQTKAQGT